MEKKFKMTTARKFELRSRELSLDKIPSQSLNLKASFGTFPLTSIMYIGRQCELSFSIVRYIFVSPLEKRRKSSTCQGTYRLNFKQKKEKSFIERRKIYQFVDFTDCLKVVESFER